MGRLSSSFEMAQSMGSMMGVGTLFSPQMSDNSVQPRITA